MIATWILRIGKLGRGRIIISIGTFLVVVALFAVLLTDFLAKPSSTNAWKTKYTEVLNEKLVLEQKLAESQQRKETGHTSQNGEPNESFKSYKRQWTMPSSHKNFNAQVAVNENLYEISIKYSNGSETQKSQN